MKAFFRKCPRWLLVLAGLALFGVARAPFEEKVRDRLVADNLLLPPPAQDAVQLMRQSVLMGTFGGLRSLVSTFLVLEAFDHFSLKEWEELRGSYAIITSLEPRDENHWRDVVWHLGINATANMQMDESIPAFERERRFHEYAQAAISLANQGIEQNPESSLIRMQLAEVYREKLKDYCETARVYGEMIGLPGSPRYAERFHGYFLAQCPGREQAAYDHLVELYHRGPGQRKPSLIFWIKELEEKLEIPFSLRIPDTYPDLPGGRQRSPETSGGAVR